MTVFMNKNHGNNDHRLLDDEQVLNHCWITSTPNVGRVLEMGLNGETQRVYNLEGEGYLLARKKDPGFCQRQSLMKPSGFISLDCVRR